MIGVKICGVCSAPDAEAAARAGATHVGVILDAPGPRRQPVTRADSIYSAAQGTKRVGVFANADPDRVITIAQHLELDVVQLHGDEKREVVERIAAAGPWAVWKAIRPADAAALEAGRAHWQDSVAALLIDGAGPGGTGTRADWDALAPGRWQGRPRFVLAGGLRPDNVGVAVSKLMPDIVDVSSGVESAPGVKESSLVEAFVRAAREAGDAAGGPGAPVE